MVVTFFARDDADYNKLANSLLALADGNSVTAGNFASNQVMGGSPLRVPEQRQGTQQLTPGTPQVVGNNTTPAAGPVANTLSVNLNNDGVVVINNAGNVVQLSGGTLNGANLGPTGGRAAARAGGNGNTFDNNANFSLPQDVRQVAAKGGPYRITLRADQLEELSKNYRLALVTRGDTVVQYQTVGDKSPQTADAQQRATLIRKAGLETAATVAAPRDVAKGASGPSPAVIDCIITMEPAPARAASTPSPANGFLPQN